MRRLVVVGTGTGVGKTYVTAALARAIRRTHPEHLVFALKPIESGVVEGTASDAALLEAASSFPCAPAPHPLYAFRDPVSPHLAARRAGAGPIDVERVAKWLRDWEEDMASHVMSRMAWCLIETAGAVFSPLSSTALNFDLARALDPAIWVLVGHDGLGILHDLRVTLEAMARRGRDPDYVVLSAAREPDASTGSNAAELAELGIARSAATLRAGGGDLDAFVRTLTSASLGTQP